jgi:glucosamine--fructose-6-phosphate aminotransferase (isomerizing)
MYDAILAQPDAIERVLRAERDAVEGLAEQLARAQAVHLVGIGTSWHAATVGTHLLHTVGAHQGAQAWNAQEFCLAPPPLGPGAAVVVLSHGGTRRYAIQALEMARSAGVFTAVITGIESVFGADAADVVVRTSERDPSAAFTVSHTAALTALAMLAVALGERSEAKLAAEVRPALDQLHVLTEWAIAAEMRVHTLATEARGLRLALFVGTGPNVATAYEVALKVNEATRLPAFGYQAEQLLHGPFVMLEPSDMVVALVTPGTGRARVLEVVGAAKAAGARTVVLADEADQAALAVADDGVPLPAVPEPLSPIAYLGPLQLLAYWLALERGVNPDLFRRDDPVHRQVWERFSL